MKSILLLGASGSIGTQTIDVIINNPSKYNLVGFSVGKRIEYIDTILTKFENIKHICVQLENDYLNLKEKYQDINFYYGDDGLINLIKNVEFDMCVNALVGFSGFRPTIEVINKNKDLALANKESLVVGGELINKLLKNSKTKIYPIDSEHSGLYKCLMRTNHNDINKLFITASGGSFRHLNREQLKDVTLEDALKHPTWSMGAKITIDSATMMNKGFELIEAYHLFNYPLSKIDVVMHDESFVHSGIFKKDNSIIIDFSKPDMRNPIFEAMNEYQIIKEPITISNFDELEGYHFHQYDKNRYPMVELAKWALEQGGTYPCVLNASNEIAVNLFLKNKITFLDIENIVKLSLHNHKGIINPTYEDYVQVDKQTRLNCLNMFKEEK